MAAPASSALGVASGHLWAGVGGLWGAALQGAPGSGCPCLWQDSVLWLPMPGLSERAVTNPWLLQEGGDRRWLVCSVSASKIVFSCAAFIELL